MNLETIQAAAALMKSENAKMQFSFMNSDSTWGCFFDLSQTVDDLLEKGVITTVRMVNMEKKGEQIVLGCFSGTFDPQSAIAAMPKSVPAEKLEMIDSIRAGTILSAFILSGMVGIPIHHVIAVDVGDRPVSAMNRAKFKALGYLQTGEEIDYPKIVTQEALREIFRDSPAESESESEIEINVALSPQLEGICGIASEPHALVNVVHDPLTPGQRLLTSMTPVYEMVDMSIKLHNMGMSLRDGLVHGADGVPLPYQHSLHCIWSLGLDDEQAVAGPRLLVDVEDFDIPASAQNIAMASQTMLFQQLGEPDADEPSGDGPGA